MVDTNALLRAWLLSNAAITTFIGAGNLNSGIYCGDLPEHFDPKLGPAIQIFTSGGFPQIEIPAIKDDRKQVRIWCDVEQYQNARQLYGLVYDLIHGASGVDMGALGFVIRCIEVTPGQDITDPDTGWATVTAFFLLMARS